MIKSSRRIQLESKERKTVSKKFIDLIFPTTVRNLKVYPKSQALIKNSIKAHKKNDFVFDKPVFKGRSISISKLTYHSGSKPNFRSTKSGFLENYSLKSPILSQTRHFLIENSGNSSKIESIFYKNDSKSHIALKEESKIESSIKRKPLIQRTMRIKQGLFKRSK